MSVWDVYEDRLSASGSTRHDASLIREKRLLLNRTSESLSYTEVKVFTEDNGYNIHTNEAQSRAIIQNVSIINSDNLNEKSLITLPGEDMDVGSLIYWEDNYWLVTERDANIKVYTKVKLEQCNHLLRWINDKHEVMEQWCIIEDGTKYLTGELED